MAVGSARSLGADDKAMRCGRALHLERRYGAVKLALTPRPRELDTGFKVRRALPPGLAPSEYESARRSTRRSSRPVCSGAVAVEHHVHRADVAVHHTAVVNAP